MAIPIRTAEVRRAFQPTLGTALTEGTEVCARVADLLRRYAPGRTTLPELARHVRDGLFSDLYELLGSHMAVQLDNGVHRRVLLSDIERLADEAMGILLSAMPSSDLSVGDLRDYAMDSGSLAAMRVLLERYGRDLAPMEREVFQRVLRENQPASPFARP